MNYINKNLTGKKYRWNDNFIIVNIIIIVIHISMLLLVDWKLKSSFETMVTIRLTTSVFHAVLILIFLWKPKLLDLLVFVLVAYLSFSLTSMELNDFHSRSLYFAGIVQTLILVLLFDVRLYLIPVLTVMANLIYVVPVYYYHPGESYSISSSVGLMLFSVLYIFVSMKMKKYKMLIELQNKESQDLIESIDDIFLCIRDEKIIYANEVAEKYFSQYGYKNLKGNKFKNVFYDLVDSDFFRIIRNVELNGGSLDYYQYFPAMQTHFKIHIKKSEKFISVVLHDVTRIESERQELFKKNTTARKSFHDIGSVLQSMILRWMMRPDIEQDLLKQMETDMTVIKDIIEDYKNYGHDDYNSTEVNIYQIVITCIDKLKANNIGVKYDTIPDVKVKGAYTLIYRILDNLTTNAVKYLNGDKVEIGFIQSAKMLTMTISNETKFNVIDKDLFAYETRIDDSSNVPGEGLGLYACKEMAESIKGKLSYIFENRYITFFLDMQRI